MEGSIWLIGHAHEIRRAACGELEFLRKTKPRRDYATGLRFITLPPLGVSIVITPLSLPSVVNTMQLWQRIAANIAKLPEA